jgi:hypothetical protein
MLTAMLPRYRACRYALGYLYPAYSNYKALEQNNLQAVKEWSTYW